jgi:hypothetical protein
MKDNQRILEPVGVRSGEYSRALGYAPADSSGAATRARRSGGSERRQIKGPRAPIIPVGSWPRRMSAAFAAAYCGEGTIRAFLSRVGKEYPHPRINDGRRKLWLRDDLDQAILPDDLRRVADVAEDL